MRRLLQHFYRATLICTRNHSVKLRLAQAWTEELDEIGPSQIPQGMRKRFASLRDAMYAQKSMPTEHAAQAAARKMSVKQAEHHAGEIVGLFQELVLMDKPGQDMSDLQEMITQTEAALEHDDISRLN